MSLTEIATDSRFNTLKNRQQHREAYVDAIGKAIANATKNMTLAELSDKLDAEHVPFAHARGLKDLPSDAQVQANGLFYERVHPVAGLVREVRPAPIFSGTPTTTAGFGPTIGQDTRDILQEAGLAEDLDALLRAGIVAQG